MTIVDDNPQCEMIFVELSFLKSFSNEQNKSLLTLRVFFLFICNSLKPINLFLQIKPF